MRRGVPKVVGETKACTSTSSGRVPSMAGSTTEPGTFSGRSAKNSSEGLATTSSPEARISKTPISLVEPKRFL